MHFADYDLNQINPSKANDLDETRRLLYMAIVAARWGTSDPSKRCELAGTLINALAHHGAGVDAEETFNHLSVALARTTANGLPVELTDHKQWNESVAWLQAQIEQITEILGA